MSKKLSHEEYIEKLKLENPTIEVLSEYKGNKEYITVKCKIDGTIWNTKPNWLKAGKGCQTCYNKRRSKDRIKGLDKFIEEAKRVHGSKYDYSKTEYVHDSKKLCVICPIHGEFWITPAKHLRNHQGCPTCGRRRIDTNDFIKRARKIHGDKYDYSKVEYVNNRTKVTIICPIHGEFKQTPEKHLSSHGCPICKESNSERLIRIFLIEKNVNFEQQKQFSWLGKQSLDFFLPDYNIAIECQGEQHFKPVEYFGGKSKFNTTRKRDLLKNKLCNENKIKILYYINIEKNFIKMNPYNKNNILFPIDLNKFEDWLK